MATIDMTRGMAGAASAEDNPFRRRTVDCSLQNLALNDIAKVIPVAAGEYVEWVAWKVVTPEGAVGTGEIGDGDDSNGFSGATAIDMNAEGMGATSVELTEGAPNTVAGYTGGKLYTADDTIDFKALAALDAAVIEIVAKVQRPFKAAALI